jgi:3-oxoacyl-[acyl-carrier protein] reductase
VPEPPVAIVTGAGRGLGAAISRRLYADGWRLVLGDLDAESVALLAAELGRDAHPSLLDVRDVDAWARAVDLALSVGDLAALVSAAARTDVRALFEIEPDEWDDVLATNLRGPFLGIRAVGPVLRDRGGGRIVTVSSDSAFRGRGVTGAHYATSKAGLLALTRRAAAALADAAVTVNAVAPGTIDGETVRELAGDRIDELAAEIPVGRLGRPQEIAALVAWLVSPDASYITGATILADGGAAL